MSGVSNDVAIPVVFPDYLISVTVPELKVQIPDLLPGIDILPPMIRIGGTNKKLPELGHAGVLFFSGSGVTKYYEYGRYDKAARGLTRRHSVPDLTMSDGRPTEKSLRHLLTVVSSVAGQRGRIMGAYIEIGAGGFRAMLRFCNKRVSENGPKSEHYQLLSHSCLHFMRDALLAAGAVAPTVIDPRPVGYIERIQAVHPPLDFDPRSGVLSLQGITLAKPTVVPPRSSAFGARR